MIGYLMHKDDTFAKLDIDDYGFKVIDFYTNRFPCESEPVLHKWFSVRQTPYGAGNLADAYKFSGINTFSDYICITNFTSINDCFWVKTDSRQTWKTVNLYHNPFTHCLEEVFMGRSSMNKSIKGRIYSPCFTNGGSFPKIFRHNNNSIYCIKGSRKQELAELNNWFIYSEILVNQVYKYLGVDYYVRYNLTMYKGSIVCTSKIFSNEAYEYFPAVYKLNGYPCYEKVVQLFYNFELFYIMLLIDCIIFNKDRHTGNYGFMVESNTGRVVSMSPVYDNNYALFPDRSIKGVTDKTFNLLHDICVSRLDDERFDILALKVLHDYPKGINLLKKMLNFSFIPVKGTEVWRVNRLTSIVRRQCSHILEML